MISDFLKKYQEEITSERIQLKEDIDLLSTKIKEESKFLSLLEESNETYFAEFTPRDLNSKNKEKAKEIQLVLNDLKQQLAELNSKMKFFDGRLIEVNNLIDYLQSDKFNSQNAQQPVSNSALTNQSQVIVSTDISNLKDSLNNILNYIVLDPYRAKIELENLINGL